MLDVWFASIPFVVCGLAFHFLRAVIRSAKVFNFSEVTFILIFFSFMDSIFGVVFENSLPNPGSLQISLMLSCRVLYFDSYGSV